MDKNVLPLILFGGVALILFTSFKAKTSYTATYPGYGGKDFSPLSDKYGADSVAAINNLYHVLQRTNDPSTGVLLNPDQIKFLLAQALLESGLFTNSPNWNMVDGNNYAGIKSHGIYPPIDGSTAGYAAYGSIDSFVEDWLWVLLNNTEPLEGSSFWDFNQRLKENGYYESDSDQYLNNLTAYGLIIADTI